MGIQLQQIGCHFQPVRMISSCYFCKNRIKHFSMKKFSFGLLVITALLFFYSCSKDKDSTIEFAATVQSRSDNKATISWTELNASGENNFRYSVYLKTELLADNITGSTFVIENLIGKTAYECRVVAKKTGIDPLESSVTFTTFENYPPDPYDIESDSITIRSVSLCWDKCIDPEKRPLHFTIYLNNEIYLENYTQTTLKLTGLLTASKYIVKITAFDDQNNTTSSSTIIYTLKKENALLIRKTMKWDGADRSYAVYLPSQINTNIPLVMYFHGAGGFAWPEIQQSEFMDVAGDNNFILVYPQATIWDEPDIPSWNVVEFIDVDDIGFVQEMLKQLVLDYAIDEKRVYATGMSSGGYMTYYLAFKMGAKLAAIAPAAGLPTTFVSMPQALQCKLPLMHIHGTIDATVSYFGGEYSVSVDSTVAFWTRNNGCFASPVITQMPDIYPNDGSTVTVYTYESPYFNKGVKLYKINNGGHSWPGQTDDPYTNRDIDLESEIWNFFKMYSIN
jgi:polyhydroxybutyrate depolymerase